MQSYTHKKKTLDPSLHWFKTLIKWKEILRKRKLANNLKATVQCFHNIYFINYILTTPFKKNWYDLKARLRMRRRTQQYLKDRESANWHNVVGRGVDQTSSSLRERREKGWQLLRTFYPVPCWSLIPFCVVIRVDWPGGEQRGVSFIQLFNNKSFHCLTLYLKSLPICCKWRGVRDQNRCGQMRRPWTPNGTRLDCSVHPLDLLEQRANHQL